MTYCVYCKKVTNDVLNYDDFNPKFRVIMVHCEECCQFKFRYLEEINNSTKQSNL